MITFGQVFDEMFVGWVVGEDEVDGGGMGTMVNCEEFALAKPR